MPGPAGQLTLRAWPTTPPEEGLGHGDVLDLVLDSPARSGGGTFTERS
jgi:hypothetical protein